MTWPRGITHLTAQSDRYSTFRTDLDIEGDQTLGIQLLRNETVTIHAEPDVLSPDPSASAYTREDLLAANPGRPGIPLSVPRISDRDSQSGGIKAPQYFAPGVAGDHGEPIAQFFQIGDFVQNNLTANAHGNGYADPNIIIPGVIGGVSVDNAAFNARYGDHSINPAVNYTVRDRLPSFAQLTSDGRAGDAAAGWSPRGESLWSSAGAP